MFLCLKEREEVVSETSKKQQANLYGSFFDHCYSKQLGTHLLFTGRLKLMVAVFCCRKSGIGRFRLKCCTLQLTLKLYCGALCCTQTARQETKHTGNFLKFYEQRVFLKKECQEGHAVLCLSALTPTIGSCPIFEVFEVILGNSRQLNFSFAKHHAVLLKDVPILMLRRCNLICTRKAPWSCFNEVLSVVRWFRVLSECKWSKSFFTRRLLFAVGTAVQLL